jgi:hypothetical protein
METKQDHKTRSIEYTHMTCLWIVQIHCIYVHVMGIFALFLFFSQASLSLCLHHAIFTNTTIFTNMKKSNQYKNRLILLSSGSWQTSW